MHDLLPFFWLFIIPSDYQNHQKHVLELYQKIHYND